MANEITKAGFAVAFRQQPGAKITKAAAVVVMRQPLRHEITKLGAVVVMRPSGAVAASRRRALFVC